jgi:hypothetical protein
VRSLRDATSLVVFWLVLPEFEFRNLFEAEIAS